CIFLLAIPFGTAASSVFQGLGKGTFSLILTAIREFLLVIVFAVAFIFLFNMGEHGVYWGINLGAIIGSLAGFLCIILYVNKLKKNSVKHD
ncbi:MAG: MATE family efflux transporter, partial [Methanobrevibacter woesei]|nr:MATE family efflux transporter [Methanobrevibacter woesei]